MMREIEVTYNEPYTIDLKGWGPITLVGRCRITVKQIMPELPDDYSWDGDAIKTGELTYYVVYGDTVEGYDHRTKLCVSVPAFIIDAFRDACLLPGVSGTR